MSTPTLRIKLQLRRKIESLFSEILSRKIFLWITRKEKEEWKVIICKISMQARLVMIQKNNPTEVKHGVKRANPNDLQISYA